MKLLISKDRTVNEIAGDLSRCFPCLKLGFFKENSSQGIDLLPEVEIPGSSLVGDACCLKAPVVVEFSPTVSVAAFEKKLFDKTGLFAKIFLRQKQKWVELKHAKDSLEKFNIIGMASQSSRYNYHTLFL